MDSLFLWSTVLCGGLVAVHLLAARFHTLVGSEKRPTHSLLAGFTTGYLFLKLLPDLRDPTVTRSAWPMMDPEGETLLFGLALVGFVVYYGVEVWARADSRHRASGEPPTQEHVYHIHLGAFTLFSAAVAFLVPHHVSAGFTPSLAFVVGLALHLLVLDHALAEMHGGRYGMGARVSLSGGVGAGWLLAAATGFDPPPEANEVLLAFLAGAIALNVIKEEVPTEKSGRPLYFAGGAVLFEVVMIAGRALERVI